MTERDEESGTGAEQPRSLRGDHVEKHAAREVAARSADGSDGLTWHKTFVLKGEFPSDHPIHEDNKTGVLQEALHRGLHPKGDVTLHSCEITKPDRRRVVSTYATYAVEVYPASADHDAPHTNAPGDNPEVTGGTAR